MRLECKHKLWYALFVSWVAVLSACERQQEGAMIIPLHSRWEFKQANKQEWRPALVPGNVHTDLMENGLLEDPYYRANEKKAQWVEHEGWHYRTYFEAGNGLLGKDNVDLALMGLDTYADIYLNDSLLLSANNMFRTWCVPVKQLLKRGENVLEVRFHSPIAKARPKKAALGYDIPISDNDASEEKLSVFTRKAPYHYGWDWGPRLVTSGIWRPVQLRAWNGAKIAGTQVVYQDMKEGVAQLLATLEIKASKHFEGTIVATDTASGRVLAQQVVQLQTGENKLSLQLDLPNAKLWWPNGLGEQPLYGLHFALMEKGQLLDSKTDRIGLRKIAVKQVPDSTGRSFEILVNGVPVFMKGGNYIPMDNFTNRVKKADYERLIKDCKEANMNMLRVWGGGIYEQGHFYDLCDEHGLLVWQDFMFACSMYPSGPDFLDNIKAEAVDNIRRLRNHPAIALWCGNNEVEEAWHHWGWKQNYPDTNFVSYKKIFHELLPAQVAAHDPSRYYLSSSPTSGSDSLSPRDPKYGDLHYWGVWHKEHPFDHFLKPDYTGRFMSEYGFQSFPSLATVRAFAKPADYAIQSEVMLTHQKNKGGNQRIKNYMAQYYGVVNDFGDFLYVSQLLQAEAMKTAVAHHRRMMPYTMGSLYWQINDCWPAASWAGLDYFGRWKALQYYAREFFAPVAVSALYEKDSLKIYAVSDQLQPKDYQLQWSVMSFDGDTLISGTQLVVLPANQASELHKIRLNDIVKQSDKNSLYAYVALVDDQGQLVSEDRLFFDLFKHLALPDPEVSYAYWQEGGKPLFSISATHFAKNVYLEIEGGQGRFSDNFFDLDAGSGRQVVYWPIPGEDTTQLARRLRISTLNTIKKETVQ